jgi:hypothetical protein
MKKDLILVTAYCDTNEKTEVLRNLVNQIKSQESFFDLMVVSHTPIPQDISDKTNFCLYDKKNELLYETELRNKPWFDPANDRPILSIHTGFFNTHLAIWRMIILGNIIAKTCGYNKVHHIEYDTFINDFSQLKDNSRLLNDYPAVIYTKFEDTIDPILFGTYQAYRLDALNENLLKLDEEGIKKNIGDSLDKSPERMLFDLLNHQNRIIIKNKIDLDNNGNLFGMSHNKISNQNTAWCLPYHDNLTGKLGFVVWNAEEPDRTITVKIIYNDEKIINLGSIEPKHWRLIDIDDYTNANKLIVILNDKIRNVFDFDETREEFKSQSFREENPR